MTALSVTYPSDPSPQPTPLYRWQPATWEEYCDRRDELELDEKHWRLFFDENSVLVVDMGWEGINHAAICDLFIALLFAWFAQNSDQTFTSLGRCLLEKKPLKAGAPDLVVYLGENYPRWEPGEQRQVDLNKWPVPDFIGEVSDTTLATDLDEKKKLYASLKIPEYWVIDRRGGRVFIFRLDETGTYQTCEASSALTGLSVTLLEATIQKTAQESNGKAALWFAQQIKK
ncbi:MAG: Uma2 family endonuclease [Phormidesmis sp.]